MQNCYELLGVPYDVTPAVAKIACVTLSNPRVRVERTARQSN